MILSRRPWQNASASDSCLCSCSFQIGARPNTAHASTNRRETPAGTWANAPVVSVRSHLSEQVQADKSVSPCRLVPRLTSLRAHVVFQLVVGSVEGDCLAVVQEAVEDGRGQDVIAQDLTPLGEVHVRCQLNVQQSLRRLAARWIPLLINMANPGL